jgi:hypothetical protein
MKKKLLPKQGLGLQINKVPASGNDISVHFTDHGGLVLANAQLQLIFWGTAWDNSSTTPSVSSILVAVNSILSGPYLSGLSQYRITGRPVLQGIHILDKTDPPSTFDDDDVIELIESNIIPSGPLPDYSNNNQLIYLVIMPPGVSYIGSALSIHGVSYSPEGGPPLHFGWVGNDGTLDHVTTYFSHELVESMTNPEGDGITGDPGSCSRNQVGWCEIADVCDFTVVVRGVVVQNYWSQTDQQCYPTQTVKEGWDTIIKTGHEKLKEWFIEKQFQKEAVKEIKDQQIEQLKYLFEGIINPYQQYIDEMKQLTIRIDGLEKILEAQPFIRKEERPDVGKDISKAKNK